MGGMSHRVAVLLVACLGGASCVVGAPPGFSDGESWSFPLVGALEGGPLIVPVTIHDRGPYLFRVDPDSPMSQLDAGLVNELELLTTLGPKFVDEADQRRPTFFAEVLRIKAGTLTVRNRDFLVMPAGAFDTGGRRIRGVIGHDLLADSTVFGFDRARGMGYIATQKGFHPPEGAIVVGYDTQIVAEAKSDLPAVTRRLVSARVGGQAVSLHVDLGEGVSQLRFAKWDAAGLYVFKLARDLVDEAGQRRRVDRGGLAEHVEVGAVKSGEVLFVKYDDRRWRESAIDGTLGLDFFEGYTTWANWHTHQLYLVPADKADHTAERIGRWGAALPSGCAAAACTTATLLSPSTEPTGAPAFAAPGGTAGPTPGPRPTLRVERSAEAKDVALEVLLEARTAGGEPAQLPRVLAIFPPGETQVSLTVDPRFAGTTFTVVDASPITRTCPQDLACIYLLVDQW